MHMLAHDQNTYADRAGERERERERERQNTPNTNHRAPQKVVTNAAMPELPAAAKSLHIVNRAGATNRHLHWGIH